MTNLTNQRRLAAEILKCGVNRVWIDPESTLDLEEAVTRSDIRHAIRVGVIAKKAVLGVSRARAKAHDEELRRGRHRGPGSRKGSPSSRLPRKSRWMNLVRAQRRLLTQLRDTKKIERSSYRVHYRKVKGGMSRSRAHLLTSLKLANVLKEEAK